MPSVREWELQLRRLSGELRESVEQWHHDDETAGDIAERLGGQWVDPTFGFALPHAAVVVGICDQLDEVIADLGSVPEPSDG